MKIGKITNYHFHNHGNYLEINAGEQPVNITIHKGEVTMNGEVLCTAPATETMPEELIAMENDELVCPFTEEQLKASGIKMHAGVVLALMHALQAQYVQKVDWLSVYSALLRRRWVDDNLSAFCRMVESYFGPSLDNRMLSRVLKKDGMDYTTWTEADERMLRRKQLATDFDTQLTEYFERKRAKVLQDIRG